MDIKTEIINWFNGPQEYAHGVMLLEKVSKKAKILSTMLQKGESKTTREKLNWELNKVACLKKIPVQVMKAVSSPQKFVKSHEVTQVREGEGKTGLIKGKDIEGYPIEVKKLVREYSSMYNRRGQLHTSLQKVGEENSPEIIDTRLKIIDQISECSQRMETLFDAFKLWETNKVIPDPSLFEPAAEKEEEQEQDLTVMSVAELKTLKKNIQTSRVKDQNQLIYGSKTIPADKKERPIPDGPRRVTLERRIARKEQMIYDIDMQLAKLS